MPQDSPIELIHRQENDMNSRYRIEVSNIGYAVIDTTLFTGFSHNGLTVMSHVISRENPAFDANVRQVMKQYGVSEVTEVAA